MKKFSAICLFLALLLCVRPISAAALTREDAAVQLGCKTLDALVPMAGTQPLLPTADSVILYELNADVMVYAYHPDERINPSAMVKIMAALVALENSDPDDVVTVKRSTLDSLPIGIVSAGLLRGEELTMRDLLYCSVMASANDATAVMAEHVAGSQAQFVRLMNDKAQQLGCTDTLFSNVNGLNDELQYSTARDLAIITKAALENEMFSEIFCSEQYTIAATNLSEQRIIYTTNHMMSENKVHGYYDERVLGGKTAAATQTSRSLICLAQIGTAQYLCVVMGASSVMSENGLSVDSFGSFLETAQLLDYAQENYCLRQILDVTQAYAQYPLTNGANDVIACASESVYAVLPAEVSQEDLEFTTEIDPAALTAPLAAGTQLGTLRITYQGIVIAQCDLSAMFSVAAKNTTITAAAPIAPDTQESPTGNLARTVLICLCAAVGAVLLTRIAVRLVKNARIRQRHRRRMRNRRRSR